MLIRCLGGEEGFEHSRQDLGGNAIPRIRDGESYEAVMNLHGYRDARRSGAGDGLFGVQPEVQDDQLEPSLVAEHGRDRLGNVLDERYVVEAQRTVTLGDDGSDDRRHVEWSHLVEPRLDERLELPHALGCPERAIRDLCHALDERGIRQSTLEHLGLPHDGGERIVDLMGDPRGELTHRGQLARV